MNCTRGTSQISQYYRIYTCTLFQEKNMCVACAVHTTLIENGINLYIQTYTLSRWVHLGLMKTNHSLHVPVISKSNENILSR